MKQYLRRIFASTTLLCLGSTAYAADYEQASYDGPTARIVGGSEVTPGEYPFIVSLQDHIGHFCGASIISPTHIMTAAHCSGGTIDAVFGLHDHNDTSKGHTIRVKKQVNHHNYGTGYDIAVYELEQSIPSQYYKPIKLASDSDAQPGTNARVIGWGATKSSGSLSDKLLGVDVPIVSHSVCDDAYAVEGESIDSKSELCAGYQSGGKDSCQGDSGGPLFVERNNEFYQVGVVSWGIGCGWEELYGVYAHVPKLKSWVQNNVPDLGDSGDGGDGGTGGGTGNCYANNITLRLETDQYGNETSWWLKNSSGSKIASGSNYNDFDTITKSFNLSDGDYTFKIMDSYGDGMTVGNGSYRLKDSNGSVIKQGSDFGSAEQTSFCVGGGSGGDGGSNPDPDPVGECYKSKVKLVLRIDEHGYETDWKIKNSSGSTIFSGGDYPADSTFKKSMSLSKGNYTFIINDDGGDGTSRGFKLRDADRELIAKGKNFGSKLTKSFCIH